MSEERSLKGIGLFQMNVAHLISIGKKESIENVENHMDSGDLIEYISQRYEKHFFGFDVSAYDTIALNKPFQDLGDYVRGNEFRKFGIEGEDDGLLLILALIGNMIEEKTPRWTILI